MILIFSTKNDISTTKVIEWLLSYNIPFLRINDSDLIYLEELTVNQKHFTLRIRKPHEDIILSSDAIKVVWYRRGNFELEFEKYEPQTAEIKPYANNINNYLKNEHRILNDFILSLIYEKPHINKHSDNGLNKLLSLNCAKKVGLTIPQTYVHTKSQKVKELLSKGSYITKSLDIGWVPFRNAVNGNKVSIYGFTQKVESDNFFLRGENIHASLMQNQIEKIFELRIFYLESSTFAVAIFSQGDEQTKLDFRNYNWSKQNRVVPFKLTESLQEQIVNYTKLVNVNCGSIDMVYTPDDKYVFLENNPVGQFDQVSRPGNFMIERHIADKLKDLYNE